jgi:hypothetical protein
VNRRTALRVGGLALSGALAGCIALSGGRPDVNPATGLAQDTSHALETTPVFPAGDGDLPEPPSTASSLADAEVALATPDAERPRLAEAFRDGTAVAFAGGDAPEALASLLAAVGEEFDYGVETVAGRPVGTAVAVPRGDVVDSYQFVAEGGWDDGVLDPLGWALVGRMPECSTFVPERSSDSQYAPAGSAWVVGRLPTGETYASRTVGSRYVGDWRFFRLRTTLHAAAGDGYDVATARRVADFANDESLTEWFPNPHERGGVAVSNHSDPVEERLDVSFSPASDRTRAALTGCCGARTDGAFAYDHRTSWTWRREGLLDAESRHGGGSGRGEWHVRDRATD